MPRDFRCFVVGRRGEGGLHWAADLEETVHQLRHFGPGAYWIRFVVADLDAVRRRDFRQIHEFRSGGADYGVAVVADRGMTLMLRA